MNIIVLVKQTFDTEEKIFIEEGGVVEDGVKFVLNPYDEYAVEEAIRIREDKGGKVTVVSAGPERTAEALRTALAMGADEAVLLNDERIGADEHAVAQALAAFVGTEPYDLVLGGNFSVDNGAGQVAVRLAKLLGIPHASAITKLDIADGRAVCSRDAEGDTEVVELPLPALFTAQQGLNEPRYPSLQGIMKAKKKPFRELTLDDFGVTAEARTARAELSLPPQRQAGKLISGEPAEQAQELFRLLRTEAKVV
ncbi:electron transfer flavoprotein subunit beta/FixA family protein [Paenibacillus apiarius]|uniref:Electron transfer flavoprotein subunit beta n=1 Tax=Paenibacillus apiarius TaxID=46240 RepID=A0ABT4DMR3_9BACL|nr:electron transfer flavoprotein subunit beta/FixA family protein [Paenibacillus apiarius]MCY9514535.1 electron transfer flavoprotein subunit beta/FixA family protein [Paenibacillus apiarius]MCY9518525.1 electron transfer flavoprotein subunit beta/FixA family protein [Paenibacillus apiarius]MCY9552613.1 electron transfer flavoprotein subunit beta/FixA family protein [Paenibacillus apiarius]MCY9557059.1 electron transfer flavoprotein subunit beta/FixA family protein [Paenibacillus apiarius]MCY